MNALRPEDRLPHLSLASRVVPAADDAGIRQLFQGTMMATGARAAVVNRTRRVVRAQAMGLQEQRRRSRSLWIPLTICSLSMIAICYALWRVLDECDLATNGVPDASDQLMLLILWSVPVTVAVLGLIWFRRARGRSGSDSEVQP